MISSDAGNNLGSGGDFTVNSGPYAGARGGSEYWARSAKFDGSTGYLSRASALTGISDSKIMSFAMSIKPSTTSSGRMWVNIRGGSNSFEIYGSGSGFDIAGRDAAGGAKFIYSYLGGVLPTTTYSTIVFMFDLSDTAKRGVYLNGVLQAGAYYVYTDSPIDLSATTQGIGAIGSTGGNKFTGDISSVYMSTDYIDFTQESNRNKFVDQLGYPKDLTPLIDSGDIASPLIYMKFDDTAALGANSGTGGNFTVNGTVTAGSDFTL